MLPAHTTIIAKYLVTMLAAAFPFVAEAKEITVRLSGAPVEGSLIFQIYDSPDAFGDLRDPAQEVVLPARGDGEYLLQDVFGERIALVVYHDENANGQIDKNFIGIPREKLAFSNNYQPKGPPSFARASIDMRRQENNAIDIEMYQLLGERGRFGLGIGIVGQSSPYVGATKSVTQVIPGITYIGERLQWFGPALRYGIAGSGKLRLAAAAEYRLGAYEASDSNILSGLGDRDDTLMAGLSLQYEIAQGFELELGYQHDVLDRIGGGEANARLSRGVPVGRITLVPKLSVNWLSSELSNYDFGVPVAAATASRPAYVLGSTTSYGLGIGAIIELSQDWQFVMDVAVERLDNEVTASPFVADRNVIKGFAMISYVF
jgi:outer membrane protein